MRFARVSCTPEILGTGVEGLALGALDGGGGVGGVEADLPYVGEVLRLRIAVLLGFDRRDRHRERKAHVLETSLGRCPEVLSSIRS